MGVTVISLDQIPRCKVAPGLQRVTPIFLQEVYRRDQQAILQDKRPDITSMEDFPWLRGSLKILDAPVVQDHSRLTYAKIHTHGFKRFQRLPLELREMIYEAAMWDDGHFEVPLRVITQVYENRKPAFPSFLPAICRVSKQCRIEATVVYVRNATFIVNRKEANEFLTAFLESIPHGKGFRNMKQIMLPSFHMFPGTSMAPMMDLDLMARCTSLHTLKVTMHVSPLWWGRGCFDEGPPTCKTVDEIVAFFGLEKIFECRKLRDIYWDGIGHWGMEDYFQRGALRSLLHQLASWVEAEFLRRNDQKVKNVVKWRF
ncbi:hypothetical protein K504DRAFT_507761 [Pleomassaria siparia CBS 279.74]|uniref:2EXR domain-containing protein n=1 Tax=Pleomassaria siparia CBS 279.74 TaxID=1314801 RepID=A0A6G1JUF2_9PLEO|nr:hypothetical protein K504DRAFT_507761 [Pleomassaria siparia CBS 279.74]